LEGATPDRDISLHNFSTRLWEQLVHFHVMWLTHWLFLWVGAMPHLCNLTVALCSHYDSIPVSTSLLRDTCGMTSTDLTRHLARKTNKQMFVKSETGSRLWAVSTQPDTELELMNHEIMT
uniref:Uncharacterized protein n=1 Tax=Panthera tigris altaica TaxID=74533 RepID=A0A8C9JHW1_PANTA